MDQIGHGFGLRQIHLPVQKSSLGKFAGGGHTRTRLQHSVQNEPARKIAPMARTLHDIFAGRRTGGPEQRSDYLVDACPVAACHIAHMGRMRSGLPKVRPLKAGCSDRHGFRPGDAHDTQCSAPPGRCDRSNGVAGSLHGA